MAKYNIPALRQGKQGLLGIEKLCMMFQIWMVCLFVEMEVVRVDTAIQSKDELISLVISIGLTQSPLEYEVL